MQLTKDASLPRARLTAQAGLLLIGFTATFFTANFPGVGHNAPAKLSSTSEFTELWQESFLWPYLQHLQQQRQAD